jgi:3-dehydroquinate synthase
MTATRIDVHPSDGPPYPVVVGVGILGELPGLIPKDARTVVVVHPEGLSEIARPACGALKAAGLTVETEPVPDGEDAKTIDVAARLWSSLANRRITRSDCIVGLGGGATTDLAGFVAATWLRGVRVVLVPTTLLGMADAAVGGKTAIDIPAGKNLVGAFHSPGGVLADLATLETLPRADYVAGLAEVIKAGFIADPVIIDLIQQDPDDAAVPHGRHARELIERAIRVKAGVVSADLTEKGLREILNYGHTLGHAIERVEGYRFRHGDAVAIGMVYVAGLARLAGRLDGQTAALHRTVLASVGLPTNYRPGAWPDLRDAMSVDKKARGGVARGDDPAGLGASGGGPKPPRSRLRLVVLDGLARPTILDDPPEQLLWQAYQEVSK